MKSKILLLIFLCLFSIKNISAQNVNGVSFSQEGDYLVIYYNLFGDFTSASISLYVSTDGGATYKGPLQKVTGDVGKSVTPGYNKKIQWDVMNEISNLSGEIVFDVRANITVGKPATIPETKPPTVSETKSDIQTDVKESPKKKVKNRFLLTYSGNGYAPIGLTLGRLGKVGFYGSMRISPSLFAIADYYTEGEEANWVPEDYSSSYTYTGDSYAGYLNLGGGVTVRAVKFLYLYGGFSYTQQYAKYEFEDNYGDVYIVQDNNQTYGAIGFDIGTIFNFNVFAFGFGLSAIPNDFFCGSFMIGFGL